MPTKKILLTGANGLLGQKLVELISSTSGWELLATGRGENRNPPDIKGYSYVSMDITSHKEVTDTVEKFKPDFVLHTAAMTDVDKCEFEKERCRLENVESVRYLIEACTLNQAHLIHLSTDFIFDGTSGPYDEEAVANPLSFYGQSKADAEELIKASSIKWSIARTVLVFGIARNMSRSNIILWVKSKLESGERIKVVTDQWRSPTLAEDLAIGCFLIAQHDAEGIFNISGGEFLTPYEMAIQTAEYYGLDASLIDQADASIFTQPAKRPPRTGFKIDKAKKVLGYNPRSFTEGIDFMAKQVLAKETTKS